MDIFTPSEAAEVLRIPQSRIKNWTIGRPIRIMPKIMAAKGKGSRNLYSIEDLYLFAFVNQLSEDGMPPSAIQELVEATSPKMSPMLGPCVGVLITNAGNEKKRRVIIMTGALSWDRIPKEGKGALGLYFLNVKRLRQLVDERVAKFRGGK